MSGIPEPDAFPPQILLGFGVLPRRVQSKAFLSENINKALTCAQVVCDNRFDAVSRF